MFSSKLHGLRGRTADYIRTVTMSSNPITIRHFSSLYGEPGFLEPILPAGHRKSSGRVYGT